MSNLEEESMPTPGNVWIMPVGADDIVPVTDTVISFEHDGRLHLAESVGTVTVDGVRFEMETECES